MQSDVPDRVQVSTRAWVTVVVLNSLVSGIVGWFLASLIALPKPTTEGDAAAVTALATAALVFVGTITFGANVGLGFVAFQTARAARDQATQESRQVDAMQQQLNLLEKQRLDAKAQSFPRLRVKWARFRGDSPTFEGELEYVHGNEPGGQVKIWARSPDKLFAGVSATMMPSDENRRFWAGEVSSSAERAVIEASPFADLLEENSEGVFGRLVVTWKGLDGTEGQYRARRLQDGGDWFETTLGRVL